MVGRILPTPGNKSAVTKETEVSGGGKGNGYIVNGGRHRWEYLLKEEFQGIKASACIA